VVNDLKAVGIRVRLRPLERAAFLKQYADKSLRHVILAGSGSPGTAATRLEQYVISGGLYTYTRRSTGSTTRRPTRATRGPAG
jgi:peptide/nickel transport system substrate-binding protein